MLKPNQILRSPEEGGGGGTATIATAPAAPAPAPAPAASAPSPAAPAPSPAAPAPAPSPSAPAPAPVADAKGYWPENWRETVSKDDAKLLARFQRYGSPEAALQALVAAQNRISSGELKPALNKDASPEEMKEWRAAHGIPESADKYDIGKIADSDKPMIEKLLKSAHGTNQTPDQVKATVQAFGDLKKEQAEQRAQQDREFQKTSEDKLRAEWGPEFRRNINLINSVLDGVGSQKLKGALLGGRLADGTPIGSDPEALKMLLGLALIHNPTGVVVPGGSANTGEGLKEELEKLQKVPTAKKTEVQSSRQRDLIDAAVKGGFMDANGNWKK